MGLTGIRKNKELLGNRRLIYPFDHFRLKVHRQTAVTNVYNTTYLGKSGDSMVKRLTAWLACLFMFGNVPAEELIFMSGDKLLTYCSTVYDTSKDRGLCEGYLTGLMDAATTMKVWRRGDVGICIPGEASPFQLRSLFLTHAEKYPEGQKGAASATVWNLFREVYPCRR